MPRKELPTWVFALAVVIELYTSTVIIFKTALPDEESYELLSVISGLPRYAVSIFAAFMLVGRDVWRYWLIVDNLCYLGLLSIACYYFMLLGKGIPSVLTFLAWLNYVFLLFFFNGHFRIFLNKMKWTSRKVFLYKLSKIYGVLVYVGLGSINTLDNTLGDDRDVYLLFVFTTAAYLSEFVNEITGVDGTDQARWHYEIEDEDEQNSSADDKTVELVTNS